MPKIYKKHLTSHTMLALCGSHTSAKKFSLDKWLKLPPADRCPKCDAVQRMVQTSR